MIAVSLAQALVVGMVPVMRAQGFLQAWHIPLVAFLLSTLGAFMFPARQSLLPQIVPQQELVHANSLMTMAQQMVFIGGYAAVWLTGLPARAAGDRPGGVGCVARWPCLCLSSSAPPAT